MTDYKKTFTLYYAKKNIGKYSFPAFDPPIFFCKSAQ